MPNQRLRLVPLGGGSSATYLLRDNFSPDLAAGAINGTLASDGVNTRTVTDTGNLLSLATGVAVFAAGGLTFGDPGLVYSLNIYPRGVVFEFTSKLRSAASFTGRIGFKTGVSAFADVDFLNFSANAYITGGLTTTTVVNTAYQWRLISDIEREYFFIKGGTFTNWTLLYVGRKLEQNNLYPSITDSAGQVDFPAPLTLYYSNWPERGLYTAYSASGAGSLTGSADGIVSFVWQPKSAETLLLKFRDSGDALNFWTLKGDQAGGTIKLYKTVAGVESEVTGGTTTQTWNITQATAQPYVIQIILSGSSVKVFVDDTAKNVITDAFNSSATGVSVSGFTWGRDLISWPRTFVGEFLAPAYGGVQKNIWPLGDSKTAGSGDISAPNGTNAYIPMLLRSLNAWERPARKAVGGMSTATLKTTIDADLASRTDIPDYVFYNMGRNDISAVQATWQTNTAYIFDAIHAKWPNAIIVYTRVWCSTASPDQAWLDLMNDTYYPIVVASRSWCRAGDDERIWMANGDNGIRYTVDGTHPNHEGYIIGARAKKIAAGL